MAAVARKRNIPDAASTVDDADDASPRKLRRAKERRVYSEDLLDHDAISYIDGQRSFDIQGETGCHKNGTVRSILKYSSIAL